MPERHSTAYGTALALLARRELSAAQLSDRLRRRGFAADSIDEALNRLREGKALDDTRVALARTRQDARKRHGPRRILLQLAAMGIDDQVALDAVRQVFADGEEARSLEQTFERRVRVSAIDLDDPAAVRKLHAHLIRRGFSPDAVSALIRKRTRSGGSGRTR